MPWYLVLLLVLAVLTVPFMLGGYFARRLRMPDYGWKIGLILWALASGALVTILGWPPSLGVDLSGGVILVYQVGEDIEQAGVVAAGRPEKEPAKPKGKPADAAQPDAKATKLGPAKMQELIAAVNRRVNPAGVKEVTIRAFGPDHLEIIIPKADSSELERIKGLVSNAGTLEFRVLANTTDHKATIEQALSKPDKYVLDTEGNVKAIWVPVEPGQEKSFLNIDSIATRTRKVAGRDVLEVLVIRDQFNVTGSYLAQASPGEEMGRPCVRFGFDAQGARLFGGLTSNNTPDETSGFKRALGIILNSHLYSAPYINSAIYDEGIIQGDFTQEQVDDQVAVLNAGSLPTALSPRPVSEMVTGPTLGRDTIQRGRQAMVVATVLVLLFMALYYRFSGLVACGALLMNLLLLVAIMILVRADFTMPGLAGLVLTIGTAVDANVLIYERMREELARGATLRMAIRNGFSRASSAIVDSNLTNLIAATVLWAIGTDQLKGFAVVLWLGVILSMFTAIFCSRVVFDIAERQHWITELRMMKFLTETHIDFLAPRRIACAASLLVILIGFGAVALRGPGILDIDFTGGTSVELLFKEPIRIAEVRKQLQNLPDLTVSDVQIEGEPRDLRFVINTSDRDIDAVKTQLKRSFGDRLTANSLTVSDLTPIEPETKDQKKQTRSDLPPDTLLAAMDPPPILLAQAETPKPPDAESADASGQDAAKATANPPTADADEPPSSATPAQPQTPPEEDADTIQSTASLFAGGVAARLTFSEPVDGATIEAMFSREFESKDGVTGPVEYEISSERNQPGDTTPQKTWDVNLKLPAEKAQKFFDALGKRLAGSPHFASASNIGGKVAADTQMKAIVAILASLLGIIIYVWVRFQNWIFGVASVVALIHDVLVTLGAVAVSLYVAPFLGFLMVDPFKVSLTVVAAFLTIIGYSINDTIVIFDRIREIRGKAPRLTAQMINNALNQTLSRTILTFALAFVVLVVLYVAAGQSVHAFAYAMLVGFVAGTYSTVYVATAIVYWMTGSVDSAASH